MIEKLNGIIDDMMEDGTIEKLEENGSNNKLSAS